MTGFVDMEGKECDFKTWYGLLTSEKAQQRYETVASKDGSVFVVWSRFKGVGGQAWQTTSELQNKSQFDPRKESNVLFNMKKEVEATEADCLKAGEDLKLAIAATAVAAKTGK